MATIDEYFPEYTKVFKNILSRTSEEILKKCPFLEDIKSIGKEELLKHIKETVKRGYSKKQVNEIYELANESIGTTEGILGAKFQLKMNIEEAEMLAKQIKLTEELENQLKETDNSSSNRKDITNNICSSNKKMKNTRLQGYLRKID